MANIEVNISLREWVAPPPFTCVLCERLIVANRWHHHMRHEPPICFSCSNTYGQQVRIPGITRGDHHVLQRLKSVADGLSWAAEREARRGRGLAY
jgi:hypothetical protein